MLAKAAPRRKPAAKAPRVAKRAAQARAAGKSKAAARRSGKTSGKAPVKPSVRPAAKAPAKRSARTSAPVRRAKSTDLSAVVTAAVQAHARTSGDRRSVVRAGRAQDNVSPAVVRDAAAAGASLTALRHADGHEGHGHHVAAPGTAMAAVEARFNTFRNKNTFWHANQAGPQAMAAFDAAFDAAVANLRTQVGQKHTLVIDGKGVPANATFDTFSPADASMRIGTWASGSVADAKRAVAASRAGLAAWSATPWQTRADVLDRAADLFTKHFYDLCAVMCLEAGKTRYEASIDVDEAVDFLRFYALTMREMNGFSMEMGKPVPTEACFSVRRPWGVFAVICPFNFPIAITTGMTVGALVTGNTVVMKPSGKGCLSGWWVFKLLREAGIPANAIQFLTASDHAISSYLIETPDVDGLCLTGSKAVGFKAMQAAASGPYPKPVIAEMGGKNAIVISDKADLDKAVQGAFRSAFGFSGQKCSACSRIYVHEKVAPEFMDRLTKLTQAATVGAPWAKDSYVGPVIGAEKLKLLAGLVEQVQKDGGIVLTGGKAATSPQGGATSGAAGAKSSAKPLQGNYMQPTLVTGVPLDHRVFREEFFMPFAAIGVVDSFQQGILEANKVEYGLTCGCFTEDNQERDTFFDQAQAGVLYANRQAGGCTAAVVNGQSFVGWKNSGSTGNGAGGRYYLLQFTKEQSRTIAG